MTLLLPAYNKLIGGGGFKFTDIGSEFQAGTASSMTWSSVVVPSGDVFIMHYNDGGRNVTSATIGGNAMTDLDGTSTVQEMWCYQGFAGGTVDIVFNFDFAANDRALAGFVLSDTNGADASSLGAYAQGNIVSGGDLDIVNSGSDPFAVFAARINGASPAASMSGLDGFYAWDLSGVYQFAMGYVFDPGATATATNDSGATQIMNGRCL